MCMYKDELLALMQKNNLTQTTIAKAIGKSPAVVSQYLKGTYPGNVDVIDELVKNYLDLNQDRLVMPKTHAVFIPTFTAQKGLEVIRMAHTEGEINVIYGDAGLGKTMIMKEYAKQYKNAILIEAAPGCTAHTLLCHLISVLGINRYSVISNMVEYCAEALCNSDRIILIDEAELLPYKSLEVLRRIHDKSGVGIVLAGMPKLLVNLCGKRGEFAQLYSRVGFAFNLGNSLPQDEIREIAEQYLGEIDADICSSLFNKSKGNARRLFKLLRGIRRVSELNKQPISKGMINSYAEMLIS